MYNEFQKFLEELETINKLEEVKEKQEEQDWRDLAIETLELEVDRLNTEINSILTTIGLIKGIK